ncbi:hypothetical protein [Streptomyces sp. NBC_00829]|uniref:hypothetical protein n=1 Tax=Streptomyces sp. NBC_00829 TaxID=2903679 RepID=UPI0038682C23|nr:hypothetical protein OG293_22370 [Streptomyces sp. NBC_00829]
MSQVAETGDGKIDVDRLVELAKHLQGVNRKDLKLAFKAINYPARTARWNVVMGNAVAALGVVVSGFLVLSFIWLGYQLAQKGHPGWCVTLCGIPLTSISSIFVLRKTIASQVLSGFSTRSTGVMQTEAQGQVPPQASPAQGPATAAPSNQSGSGAPAP